jgi:hypothetical protein
VGQFDQSSDMRHQVPTGNVAERSAMRPEERDLKPDDQ